MLYPNLGVNTCLSKIAETKTKNWDFPFSAIRLFIANGGYFGADFMRFQNLMKPRGVAAGVWPDIMSDEGRTLLSLMQKAQAAREWALS